MTLSKNRVAARFSNSRDSIRLPLLSNSMAIRTGVSERLISLIVFTCPSTRSSKSSSFRLVTAMPRLSNTVVGTGTRFEVTRTTSAESSVLVLGAPDTDELFCCEAEREELVDRVTWRAFALVLVFEPEFELGSGFCFCLPDCECVIVAAKANRTISGAMTNDLETALFSTRICELVTAMSPSRAHLVSDLNLTTRSILSALIQPAVGAGHVCA